MLSGWTKYIIPYGDGPEEEYELYLKELEHPFALRVLQIDDVQRRDEYGGELVAKSTTDHKNEFGDEPAEPEEGEPPLWAHAVGDPILETHTTGEAKDAMIQLEQKVYALFRLSLGKLAK